MRFHFAGRWIVLGIVLSIMLVYGLALRYRVLVEDPSVNPGSATYVSWDEAVRILHEGRVREVGQAHSRTVWLTLEDGTRYVTKEPVIDEVGREMMRCGEPCKDILFWTE